MNIVTWQPGVKLEELEVQVIRAAMGFFRNTKTSVASSLGISVRTLDAKLEKIKKADDELAILQADAHAKRQEFIDRSRAAPAGTGNVPINSMIR